MSVSTTKYIRKPLYVDAVRVTNDNFDEIAVWCQGEIVVPGIDDEGHSGDKKYIKIRVHNPKIPRQTTAFVGDWVLYTERGYKIYTSKAFHSSFDEVGTVENSPAYPYADGDTTVIGPECFARPDGVVLSWKGVNYIPQSSNDVRASDTVEGDRQAEGVL